MCVSAVTIVRDIIKNILYLIVKNTRSTWILIVLFKSIKLLYCDSILQLHTTLESCKIHL